MRVGLLLEQVLSPVPGGTGRYSAELAAALVRTAEPGDEVVGWVARHRDVRAAQIPGVAGPIRLPVGRRALARLWQRGLGPAPRGVDVVHAPTALMPPRRHTPLAVTLHDAVAWTHPETLTPHGAAWHRAIGQRAADEADAIIVPTHHVAGELIQVLGIEPARLHVLGAGVPEALLAEPDVVTAAKVRAAHDVPDTYLLAVATLEPRKGLDVLFAALDQLGDAAPQLLVVGQAGWGDVSVPPTVRALGRVDDADLAVLLRGATALVAPSREEGYGLPVLEAMAVGTPVICSDAPAFVEVAGDAALIVARDDAIALAEAIGHLPSVAGELVERGRRQAAGSTWDDAARRAWAVYRSLGR